MSTQGLQVSTPSDTEIVMTRTFNAPRRLVWDAMTKPDLLPRWLFSPPGWTMTMCKGEPRVGGAYRWEWSDDKGNTALVIHGVFREVNPPERIVHTEVMEMGCGGPVGELLATIELTEKGGATHMRITLSFDSKRARDGALASGMERGMEAGYKTLDAMLAAAA
jgi:uncharacterized protein YndB with AHSA1/START domain